MSGFDRLGVFDCLSTLIFSIGSSLFVVTRISIDLLIGLSDLPTVLCLWHLKRENVPEDEPR